MNHDDEDPRHLSLAVRVLLLEQGFGRQTRTLDEIKAQNSKILVLAVGSLISLCTALAAVALTIAAQ